jgi:hypothetical protein
MLTKIKKIGNFLVKHWKVAVIVVGLIVLAVLRFLA